MKNIKFFVIICFFVSNVKGIMAQSIELNDLLNLQSSKSSSYIANFLNSTGEWINNDSTFEVHQHYKWYKTSAGEQFEPHTKDQIHYIKVGSFDPAIEYITLAESNFDSVKSAIHSSMSLDEMLMDNSQAKMYKYSNADVVIEVMEPLVVLNYGVIRYAFFIYTKKDYNNGFKIR